MADLMKTKENLEARGYAVRLFPDKESAAKYLNEVIDGTSVGFGGSMTLDQMGLFNAAVYLSSVNALAETGEIVNIDGAGNRVASTLYGHKKVYLIISRNKLAADYDGALWRARNVAAPKNAQRLNRKTPCAIKGDRCYDCKSPDRICCGLVVLWRPMMGQDIEIILVDEDLGC